MESGAWLGLMCALREVRCAGAPVAEWEIGVRVVLPSRFCVLVFR